MKGKILEIDSTGSWEGQHGVMYTYMVKLQTMNDLTFQGVANAKSETIEGLPYKVGDEVEFEHTESGNEYPDKLKIKNEVAGQYLGREGRDSTGGGKGSNRAFALSYAKDLAVARINTNNAAEINAHAKTRDIIDQADTFVKWLDS